MDKYRVRKGFFGKCILQVLQNDKWRDVNYNQSPRALVSVFEQQDKIKSLEIEVTELHVELEINRKYNKSGE